MKYNILILADHNIGYNITEFLLNQDSVSIKGVFTNKNNNAWWKNILSLSEKNNDVYFGYYENEINLINFIKNDIIDIVFLFSWKHIMSEKFISFPKIGIVNLHYSLLPKYRGSYPNVWPIINGEKETGITYHFIDNNIDTGNIITQQSIKIEEWDTAKSLLPKLDICAYNTFLDMWNNIEPKKWKKKSKKQANNKKYYSINQYNKLNEIDINKTVKIIDFINLLKGKSFSPEYKNLYYIEKKTNKKIFISTNFFIE